MLNAERVFKRSTVSGLISDFLACDNRFFFFVQKSNFSQDNNQHIASELSLLLKKLYESLKVLSVCSLAHIEKNIDDAVKRYVAGNVIDGTFIVVNEEVIYLVTRGKGKIFLKRNHSCALIIAGDNRASGKTQEQDIFICLSDEGISHPELIQKKIQDTDIEQSVQQFDAVETVLIVRFLNAVKKTIRKERETATWKNKKFTIIAVIILFILLIWSVGFGIKRRSDMLFKKETALYKEKITYALFEAKETATLDDEESLGLINKAKEYLTELKSKAGKRKIPNIDELSAQIEETEKNITKKEERQYDEFYNLTLIEKYAKGEIMSVDQDTLAVLDTDAGAIYMISLSKKSTDTIKKNEIRGSSLMSFYNNKLYIFKQKMGLYIIDKEKKLIRVIEHDDDWGHIVNFSVYNGNIYLLDSVKNEVYKYLVAENGYSSKTSYFKKKPTENFGKAHSIAIDSSIYIEVDNRVYKYTSGIMDGFSIKIPGETKVLFVKLFTDKTVNKIYLWDKEQGKIFITSKQGSFEKQLSSSILKKASDFIVREKNANIPTISGIFVLVKDIIYKIPLE